MKIDKDKAVFLLGGHDLEMITIREVLIKNGFKLDENLFDKNSPGVQNFLTIKM